MAVLLESTYELLRSDLTGYRDYRDQVRYRLPEPENVAAVEKPVGGRPWTWVSNVSPPMMMVYAPKGKNTGVGVIVFPGGGFEGLAIDLEGTEVCDWLTSRASRACC